MSNFYFNWQLAKSCVIHNNTCWIPWLQYTVTMATVEGIGNILGKNNVILNSHCIKNNPHATTLNRISLSVTESEQTDHLALVKTLTFSSTVSPTTATTSNSSRTATTADQQQ